MYVCDQVGSHLMIQIVMPTIAHRVFLSEKARAALGEVVGSVIDLRNSRRVIGAHSWDVFLYIVCMWCLCTVFV